MTPTRLLSAESIRRALAELVLIVAGILIALYLDGWWEDRNVRQAERAALEEIDRDLAADVQEAQVGLATFTSYRDFGSWWETHRGQDLTPDEVVPQLRTILPIHLYQPQNAGYVALRSSGRLWIIRNSELRGDLVRYFEHYQKEIAQIAEFMVDRRQRVEDAMELDIQYQMGGSPNEAPLLQLMRPWREIPTDPRFSARIRTMAASAELVVNSPHTYQRYLSLNAELRGRIAAELGKTPTEHAAAGGG